MFVSSIGESCLRTASTPAIGLPLGVIVTATTTKTPDTPADGDIIFDFGNHTAKPGDTVKVAVTITPNGNPIAGVDAVLKQDSPIELTNIGGKTAAFGNLAVQSNLAECAFNVITLGGDKNDTPMVAEDGAQFILLGYKVPADCDNGVYEIGFDDKCMVFMDNTKNTYSVSKANGFITVDDGTGETPTTTTTKKPVTTTVKPSDDAIIFDFGNWEAQPGDTVKVPVLITPNGNPIAGVDAVLKQDAPIELTNIGGKTAAFNNLAVQSNLAENAFNVITLGGEKNDTPMVAEDGSQFILLGYKVPEDCAEGVYEIGFGDKCMVFMDNSKNTYAVTKLNGFITVGDSEVTTTTTTKTTTTEPVPVTTTTVTNPPAVDGEAQWLIPTVTVKPGAAVTMDVIVKNSDIEVAGAQFHINAASPVVYGGATGGDAYKSDLVQNDKNPEFAFGEGIGSGIKAENDAVILTLKYTAPTAAGTYPVEWSEVYVSDTNGNDITDKITCIAGAIIVEEEEIDPFDGKIKWVLDKKTAAPGETVTISAVVSNPDNEDLPVAGAQFDINADAPIVYNSASGNPYGNELVKNDNTKEFAFAEANGAGVASKDGDIILSIEYTVPVDCAEGVYAVKWSDAYISDTYGRPLLDNVTLEDGSITVKKNIAEGNVSWVIPEVEAAPGSVVEMVVKVSGSSDPALEVAGAQYDITVAEPIEYSTANGTPYGNELVQNDATAEFAWAEANGAGKAAADGDVLFTIIYNVPETTEEGEYPVNWSDAYISDTNGNDITDKVELVNGKIIIKKDVTTTTTTTTTTVSDPEEETTTTTTASDTTTTTTSSGTTTTSSTTTTTTSSGTTTTSSTTSTTTTTLNKDQIVWKVEDVTAKAGETVKVQVKVEDPNATKLLISGADFTIVPGEGFVITDATGSELYAPGKLVWNPETGEFHFSDGTGKAVPSEDGGLVLEFFVKVPDDAEPGEYPIDLTIKAVAGENGEEYTNNNVLAVDGSITVLPSEIKLDRTYAELETQVGFYFSHDNGERDGKQIGGFNKNQVLSIKLYDVYVDEDGNEVEVVERTGVSLDNINYNGLTPQKVYSEDRTNFTYDKDVQVYYQDGETNLALVDKDGNPLYITAYIGVKGDITLDNIVNGSDATYALMYYTKINAGVTAVDPRTIIATANKLVSTGDDNLDHLAVFLADVTENEYGEDNWKLRKQDRIFNGTDATLILQFYTIFNRGEKQDAQDCWNTTVPNRFGDVA